MVVGGKTCNWISKLMFKLGGMFPGAGEETAWPLLIISLTVDSGVVGSMLYNPVILNGF